MFELSFSINKKIKLVHILSFFLLWKPRYQLKKTKTNPDLRKHKHRKYVTEKQNKNYRHILWYKMTELIEKDNSNINI
jgi:hypothetical protein